LIGMLFSIATMGDCSFVELDERLFFPSDFDVNLPLKVTQTQYVGFLTWQMLDGYCYFYNHGNDPENQINEYMDILGTDYFELARYFAMGSACLSFVYFCYLLSFTCSSQVQGVRRFNAVFLSIALTGVQGVCFVAFQSDFCDEYGCTFSRSAGFCVAAMGCFFLSGLCFLGAKEYPGVNRKKPRMMSIAQVAPEQRSSVPEPADPRTSYIEELVMEDYDEEEAEEEVAEEEVAEEEEVVEEEYVEEEYIEGEVEEVTAEGDEVFEDDHPELAEGEDMTLYTEVTAEETRTVQTITHTDGSQTVTEAVDYN